MKDGVMIKSVKIIALTRYRIDLLFTRFILKLKSEPGYIIKGECCGCGSCCETPMIRTYAPFFYLKSLRWLYLTWHKKINGFILFEEKRIERTFVFKCTHLSSKTKKCDAYSSRPGMCRDYPRNILYNTPPNFISGCSYSPIAKNANKINKSLDKLNLPKEKLDKIKKAFFAE